MITTSSLPQALDTALQMHRTGNLEEAERLYREILKDDPQNSDALHLSGVIAQQREDLPCSIELIRSAISIRPEIAHYHHNLANSYLRSGLADLAASSYREAVRIRPSYFEAHQGLGNALSELHQWEAAVDSYRNALKLQPSLAEAHYSLAQALRKLGQKKEAFEHYRAALQIDPKAAKYFFSFGGLLLEIGDLSGAMECYRACIVLRPDHIMAHNNLGLIYASHGDFQAAIGWYQKAIAIEPRYDKVQCNLGVAHLKLGNLAAAEEACAKALALNPRFAEAQYNLANVFREQGRLEEAVQAYRRALEVSAIEISPDNPRRTPIGQDNEVYWQASNNLGCTLEQQGRIAESLACHENALKIYPQNPTLHFNRGLTLLAQGNFGEGLQEYEWRWRMKDFSTKPRNLGRPLWTGEPLQGATILLHAEQGFGDTIQFVRYASLVAERGGEVILEVQPRLRRLFSNLPGVSKVIAQGESLPETNWHCPLMSLPLIFGTRAETIPSATPYLQAPAAAIGEVRKKWPGEKLRVGLAWAGSPSNVNGAHRSMPLHYFTPLGALEGVSYYSLQCGDAIRQITGVSSDLSIMDACAHDRDFADTAALIAGLDLVITVDTSIAHLAGALGIPTWVLLSNNRADWRWMRNRSDSPWYSSVRLLRQPAPGDWQGLMEEVKTELQQILQHGGQQLMAEVGGRG